LKTLDLNLDRPWASARTLSPIAVAVATYITVLINVEKTLGDPDIYLHVAVGRWIIEHGASPRYDIFSYSMQGTPWITHEWLSQAAIASLFDAYGPTGLVVVTALLFAGALGLLARTLLRYVEPTYMFVGVMTAWGLCSTHLLARPHVVSLPLLVLWSAVITKARFENREPPMTLALIIALWANLHGAYIVGIGLAGLFALEAVFEASDSRAALRQMWRWGLFCALSLLAALITPSGLAGVLLPFRLADMNFAMSWLNEWQSVDFQKLHPMEIWLLMLLLSSLGFGLRLPLTRIIIMFVLLHLALSHQRHSEILGLITPILIAPTLARRSLQPTVHWDFILPDRFCMGRAAAAATRVMVLVFLVFAAVYMTALRSRFPLDLDRFAPKAALEEVARNHITGRVFNDYNFGGYLIFVGIAPFIDGRADLYGDQFIRRSSQLAQLQDILNEYNVSWTLLEPENPGVVLLDNMSKWTRLYADRIAVVHVRNRSAQ
jgi:hypothetical protein